MKDHIKAALLAFAVVVSACTTTPATSKCDDPTRTWFERRDCQHAAFLDWAKGDRK